MKKISQLYRPVLMLTINYKFVAVRSNRASVVQQRGKSCGRFRCEHTAGARIEAERPKAIQKLAEDPLLYRKIVFSNEAHFWLNGYVNEPNRQFWSEDQPEALQKLPMHAEDVTIW